MKLRVTWTEGRGYWDEDGWHYAETPSNHSGELIQFLYSPEGVISVVIDDKTNQFKTVDLMFLRPKD